MSHVDLALGRLRRRRRELRPTLLAEIIAQLRGSRTAGSSIRGFYDDVVAADRGRPGGLHRAPLRRCRARRGDRRLGPRRRGRATRPSSVAGAADPRRERHLGRLHRRRRQDHHPGPRPRQGQLPPRGGPARIRTDRELPGFRDPRRDGLAARRHSDRRTSIVAGAAQPACHRPSLPPRRPRLARGDGSESCPSTHPRRRLASVPASLCEVSRSRPGSLPVVPSASRRPDDRKGARARRVDGPAHASRDRDPRWWCGPGTRFATIPH